MPTTQATRPGPDLRATVGWLEPTEFVVAVACGSGRG
jgi:hypothetical protein